MLVTRDVSLFNSSFLRTLIGLIFNIYHNYSIVLIYVNTFGNFKPLMLLSTSLICLALAVCSVLLQCCLLTNFILSTNCCRYLLKMSLRLIFFHFICYFRGYGPHRIIVFSSQFFILGTVFYLSHAFCFTYDCHQYAQLASFKIFQKYEDVDIFI